MSLRLSEVLEERARDVVAPTGFAEDAGPSAPRPPAAAPRVAKIGEAVLVRPLAGQGGPLPGEPETAGSLIRALFYAVPVALGGWGLIGALIWSLL